MKKKSHDILKLFLISCFVVISSAAHGQIFTESGMKFLKMLNWLEDYYVDTVNVDKLTEKAIIEMLHKLDPHSSYISKEEVADLNEPLQGNFEGIGITFSVFRDTIMVLSVLENGPSEKSGLKPGDRILFIDKVNVAGVGINSDGVFAKIRGKKGTDVEIRVKRKGVPALITYTITRDKIPIHSVEAAYKLDKNIGYMKISRFSSNTMTEFKTELARLNKQNINGLILDLTGNGGGFLDVAVSLADEFLDKEKLIVYTQGIHSPKKEYFTTAKGMFEKGKLVILIDESSASASEIFAGAIQDWDRGVIVGRRSYGKGLVQRPFMFPDGAMVRLTIARYYTPSGRLIQKSYSNGYQDYSKELARRVKNGELVNESNNHFNDSLKFSTLIKKRTVYGGGGIMPDLFVPLDTASYRKEVRTLATKGVINRFVIDYVDVNRDSLKLKFKSFDQFKERFPGADALMLRFTNFYRSENQGADLELSEYARNYLLNLLKAYIARDLFGNSEFYEIYNQTEHDVIMAQSVLNNWQENINKLQLK